MTIELYRNSQNSFYSDLMKISEYFNLYDLNYNSLNDSKMIKQLVDLMKKKMFLIGTRRFNTHVS